MTDICALRGSIVHSISFGRLEIVDDGAIIYSSLDGIIHSVIDFTQQSKEFEKKFQDFFQDRLQDFSGKLLIPGFIDAHCHAPQYVFTGTGMDLPLLQWLEKYTFPCEARFSDSTFARMAYEKSIKRHLKCGTTFASYFATIHIEACKVLVDVINSVGQRAFVGKVSMDRNSPDFYIEETADGCALAEEFSLYVLSQTDVGRRFLASIDSCSPCPASTESAKSDSSVVMKMSIPPSSSLESLASTEMSVYSAGDVPVNDRLAITHSISDLDFLGPYDFKMCTTTSDSQSPDISAIGIDAISESAAKSIPTRPSLSTSATQTQIYKLQAPSSQLSISSMYAYSPTSVIDLIDGINCGFVGSPGLDVVATSKVPVVLPSNVTRESLTDYNPGYSLESAVSLTDIGESSAALNKSTLLNQPYTPLVMPVVTPRFVPTCTVAMMRSLGQLAEKYGLPVQSHMSESLNEIEWVSSLHPDCPTYAQVYEKYGLLNKYTFMAHCCHSPVEERRVLARTGASAVHCASSNFMLCSGVMDVRTFLDEGIKVALGTDVAGGYSPSMLDAMRQAIVASRVKGFDNMAYKPRAGKDFDEHVDEILQVVNEPYNCLNYAEAFHLATVGGAEVLGMGNVVGNFLPQKKLDCLVVDVACRDSPIDLFGDETTLQKFEKFLFLGDDRNIVGVFVDGRKVI